MSQKPLDNQYLAAAYFLLGKPLFLFPLAIKPPLISRPPQLLLSPEPLLHMLSGLAMSLGAWVLKWLLSWPKEWPNHSVQQRPPLPASQPWLSLGCPAQLHLVSRSWSNCRQAAVRSIVASFTNDYATRLSAVQIPSDGSRFYRTPRVKKIEWMSTFVCSVPHGSQKSSTFLTVISPSWSALLHLQLPPALSLKCL